MSGTSQRWECYLLWNTAIADVVFGGEQAGRPVYLDLETEILDDARNLAEPGEQDSTSAFVEACLATLSLDAGPSEVLSGHLERLDRWYQGSMLDPPPTLGLLALLSLAAERMRDGENMRPHNFYGRLAELSNLDEEQKQSFTEAYRRKGPRQRSHNSRRLWESLNDWLEMHEGSLGIPTAHPLGQEHIGWALSQALVREADRAKFVELFAYFGLPANGVVGTNEMSILIDEWMSRRPCPATNHLERLWNDVPLTRPRISELACLALEHWDGRLPEGSRRSAHREIDSVKLSAVVRTFPTRRLNLSLVIPTHAREQVETVDVLDLDDSVIASLDLVAIASGWLGVSASQSVDTGSLLGGEVRLRRPGFEVPLKRRSRRLIPLRWDDLLASYVECERVQLGEKMMVLTLAEIAMAVQELLERSARPGYRRLEGEEVDGLPGNWVAFDGVQILSSIPSSALHNQLIDFNVLQPLALSQAVLQGGLRLPGHLTKWHRALPPELRASSDDGESFKATITCIRPLVNPAPADKQLATSDPALVWDLAELELPDGDYEIEVHAGPSLISIERLRLRSADSPALRTRGDGGRIVHDRDASAYGLVTVRPLDGIGFQIAPDEQGRLGEYPVPTTPGWWAERATKQERRIDRSVVRFPEDSTHSCIRTGAHHMAIQEMTPGVTAVEGVCKHCGLVKAYPTRYRARRRRSKKSAPIAPKVQVGELPPIRAEQSIDWEVAFDALCHVGSGSLGALERITSQMDSADLFTDAFVRRLEALGHIEVERSPITLAMTGWQVNDPALVELEDHELLFVGFRCERVLVAIEDSVWKENGEVTVSRRDDSPPRVVISGLDEASAKQVAAAIGEAAQRPARVIGSAARTLAANLMPLSHARVGLPTTSAISARSYERWDPITARFEPSPDAGSPGAFRLSTAGRAYIYRQAEHLGAIQATLGDARIVKYLAAADAGRSLLGYSDEDQVLYVPLGADLPGLFGRAAVLCNGKPPFENLEERILEYHRVPADLAAQLNYLLMN